jgi:hypothetical protein
MDLIDKKLSEKLKLFEYIDQKYGTNIEDTNYRKRESESNTGPQNEYFSNNELFDNIYSDFKTNSYKSFFHSPSSNTIDTTLKKNHSKLANMQNSKKSRHTFYKNNNNLSHDRELTTNEGGDTNHWSKFNKTTKRNISKLIPPNDSGNRLYNYGYYIKNKLNKKRKLAEEKIKRDMTPKILNRSKEIKRDPKFEERLYYAEKNDTNDNIYNRKRTLSRDNINYNNYNKTKFTYHPKINKKSLLIASKLEPSTLRLNRKKNNFSNQDEDKTVIDYYTNLFKDKTNYKRKINNNISPSCGNEKSNELYLKGLEDIKRKEQNYNENKHKKEEEKMRKQMTPKILNRSKEMIRDKDRDPNKFEERLYYAEKNDTNDSIYNRKRTLSRENINYEKYNSTKFTYHQKINKKVY